MPLVMKVLEPLSTQLPSSCLTARALMPWRSLPVPGSVIAIAVMISPEQNPGSQRCFCSSVARRSR